MPSQFHSDNQPSARSNLDAEAPADERSHPQALETLAGLILMVQTNRLHFAVRAQDGSWRVLGDNEAPTRLLGLAGGAITFSAEDAEGWQAMFVSSRGVLEEYTRWTWGVAGVVRPVRFFADGTAIAVTSTAGNFFVLEAQLNVEGDGLALRSGKLHHAGHFDPADLAQEGLPGILESLDMPDPNHPQLGHAAIAARGQDVHVVARVRPTEMVGTFIYHSTKRGDAEWPDWTTLNDAQRPIMNVPNPKTVGCALRDDGRLVVVAVNDETEVQGSVRFAERDVDGSWSPTHTIGVEVDQHQPREGGSLDFVSIQAVAVANHPEVHVVALDNYGRPWHSIIYDDGGVDPLRYVYGVIGELGAATSIYAASSPQLP